MMGKIFFTAFFGFIMITVSASALDIEREAVKLVLYEDVGRFNVFVGNRGGSAKPFSFFVADDPRTTRLQILVGNNIYTMGDQGEFNETVQKTENGARFSWTSPFLRVTEEFTLLSTADSPLSEGVKILIKIENISEENQVVGVRYIFDTWLGEKANTHFLTSANTSLAKEVSLNASTGGSYWISPFIESDRGDGLLVLTDAKYVTQPDAVIFANWKRLNESTWEYAMAPNLDFNFYPYSFNDSAAAQYYNTQTLKRKEAREISLILGNSSSYMVQKSTYVADKTTTSTTDDKNKLLDANDRPDTSTDIAKTNDKSKDAVPVATKFTGSVTKPFNKSNYELVNAEIERLDQFILDINGRIQAGKPLTDAELKQYRQFLIDIETKAVQK